MLLVLLVLLALLAFTSTTERILDAALDAPLQTSLDPPVDKRLVGFIFRSIPQTARHCGEILSLKSTP